MSTEEADRKLCVLCGTTLCDGTRSLCLFCITKMARDMEKFQDEVSDDSWGREETQVLEEPDPDYLPITTAQVTPEQCPVTPTTQVPFPETLPAFPPYCDVDAIE